MGSLSAERRPFSCTVSRRTRGKEERMRSRLTISLVTGERLRLFKIVRKRSSLENCFSTSSIDAAALGSKSSPNVFVSNRFNCLSKGSGLFLLDR